MFGLQRIGTQPANVFVSAARRIAKNTPMMCAVVVLLALVITPMGILLFATFVDSPPRPGAPPPTFTLDNYVHLLSGANVDAILNSLYIGVGGTALATGIGCVLAWLAARTDVPGRSLVQMAGFMPLFLSTLVGALAWSLIASPQQGYANIFLRSLGLPAFLDVYTLAGIIFVFGIYYAPYAFLFVYAALSLLNPELEEAAHVHGAGPLQALRTITFGLAGPAILGAATLTMVLIMENFPIPQILGTPNYIETIPSQIYRLMASVPAEPNVAATIGLVLVVIMVVMLSVQRRILTKRQFTTVTGKGFQPRRARLGPWRWVGLAFALGYACVAVFLPLLALAIGTFRPNPYVPNFGALFEAESYTFAQMREVLGMEEFRVGMVNSLLVGLGAALLGGVVYLLIAYVVNRTETRGRHFLAYVAMWPAAVPALIIGLGFLWTWVRFPLIYGTILILILAYVGRFTPQGFQGMSSSIVQVHKELEESAHVAGATRLRAVWEILVPLIRTGVVSTMVLVFILSMRELSIAIFLFTSDTQVLSIAIYNQWEGGRFPPAAAMSLLYVLVLFIVTILCRRWLGIRNQV